MCGIVGYIGEEQAAPILLNGLQKLEYRGYDSAGVAVYNLAGARAEARVDAPGSFQVAFLDELYKATPEDIAHNPFEIEEA